jgi:spore germination protein GerM
MMEMLVAGPTASEKAAGAFASVPPRTQVNSVTRTDSVVTVDFSEPMQHVGGACTSRALRDAITRTLTHLPGVKSVVITAAGSRDLALNP